MLVVRFDEPMQTLGWPVLKPGFASAREIVWLEVHDGDLPIHVDAVAFLKEKLAAESLVEAAAFMTSRDIRRHYVKHCGVGAVAATCVATVGLSNAERVGSRRASKCRGAFGTINTLVHVSCPLALGAFIEAVSIAAQARTAAVMETSPVQQVRPVTGTGTDCIIIAAPKGGRPADCAGLHTDIGEAIGAAVYDAIFAGATQWWVEATPHPAVQRTRGAL
ncbi:adenosylcobinamide amidohydrolase [Methylocystis bryophila]|uniref:adenosylcobinamide amidohydrolase n=1 Tax=Methylocystis bryophila TaxID=655015 RepID=UPI001FD9CE5E|nr:adenosylcobinamide amidohydrolase [Methylocystis bryophila]